MQVSYYKALKMQDLNLDPEKGHFSLDNLEEQMDDQEMLWQAKFIITFYNPILPDNYGIVNAVENPVTETLHDNAFWEATLHESL